MIALALSTTAASATALVRSMTVAALGFQQGIAIVTATNSMLWASVADRAFLTPTAMGCATMSTLV